MVNKTFTSDDGEFEYPTIDVFCLAAQANDLDTVKSLLAEGIPVSGFDVIAKTALHYAAEEGHIDMVKFLLDQGADINAHDESRIGNTVLREVASNCSYEMAKLLVDAGADPTIPGWLNMTALDRSCKRKKPEGQRVHEFLVQTARRRNPSWDRLKKFS